jgi:probable F420-dependent oxidoreductase
MTQLKFGLVYPDLRGFISPGELGKRAEQWGFDTFWVTDHALKTRLDPLTVLAAVSQVTQRLRLGTAVMVVPYRHPYLTAKAAVSVDVLSNGRLMLGLGIGDLFHEFEALEIDRRVRGRLTDERLDIIRRLFSEENLSFEGKFHHFRDLSLLPRPVQEPSIPIWLGGHWDDGFANGVVRRTGRFADGFIPTFTPVEGYAKAQAQISLHAEEAGRDPAEIEWGAQLWTYVADNTAQGQRVGGETLKQRMGLDRLDYLQGTAIGSAKDCIDAIERYAAQGVTEFNLSAVCEPAEMVAQYRRIAEEILPHFKR